MTDKTAVIMSDTLFISVPPAVQSLSEQSDLETVVKTLAPALLAELSKLKSSSSSGSKSPTSQDNERDVGSNEFACTLP